MSWMWLLFLLLTLLPERLEMSVLVQGKVTVIEILPFSYVPPFHMSKWLPMKQALFHKWVWAKLFCHYHFLVYKNLKQFAIVIITESFEFFLFFCDKRFLYFYTIFLTSRNFTTQTVYHSLSPYSLINLFTAVLGGSLFISNLFFIPILE